MIRNIRWFRDWGSPDCAMRNSVRKQGNDDWTTVANKQISPAAKALQSARKSCGLTLDAAAIQMSNRAKDTGSPSLSASQLSRIETGVASLSQERLEQLADFYGLSVPDLLAGAIVKAPNRVEVERLKAVVALVQQVVIDLRAKPSAGKMADAVALIYERETAWAMSQTGLKVEFDPERHRGVVELAFKK